MQFFAVENDVAAVWLFGSQAQGRARPDSDIDLGVLYADERAPQDVVSWHRQMYSRLAALGIGEVDLTLLDRADPVLRRQVFEHGRPLLVRDPARAIEFRVRSWAEYLDLAPYRDRVLAAKQAAARTKSG